MKDTTKLRAMYWGTIVGLICWITFQNERIERYKYAEKFLGRTSGTCRKEC